MRDTSLPNALTGITDENGNRFATYAYDAQGRAISTQHADGAELTTVTYNTDGSTGVTDANGNLHSYTFTTQFNRTKPTSASNASCGCGSSAYAYDTNGFISSRTDFNGNVTTYIRNTRGLETSRTEASGTAQARTITTTWHATFRLPLTITEPNRVTTFTYDAKGNLLTKTITAGSQPRTWTYTYNAGGQVLTAKDPLNNTTTYTYDSAGGLATVTDALGHATRITSYDPNGRPLSLTDPNGLVTSLAYDARGRLTSRTSGGEITTYDYDAAGQLMEIDLPDGSSLDYTYDAAHRLTGLEDALGNSIVYTLDGVGNRVKEQVFDPSNHLAQTRSHAYDALNRLSQDIGAQGQTTAYAYDNNGNLTGTTDPLSHTTSNVYDALNRLVKMTDPNNGVTTYGYDANDHQTGLTDPRSLATAYTYDGLDNLNSVQSPDTGTTTKAYDAAGNVLTSTDARGKTTTYTYDALNRPTKATFADGASITRQYDQGGIGRLYKVTDSSGSTTYSYDSHGRVTQKQQVTGSVNLTTGYTYDASGRRTSMTYPSGRQLAYLYDTGGHVIEIDVDGTPLVSSITYQAFGSAASWTQGSGVSTYSRTFDQDGRISGIKIGANPTINYTYDAAGRITGIIDSNEVRPNLTAGATSYSVSGGSNQILGRSGPTTQTYTYDAAGNLTGDGTFTYGYDARGRLVQVTAGSSATSYAINGLGQRVSKSSASAMTIFAYDEAGHLIGEYDATGNVIQETVWLGDLPVGVLKPGAQYYVNPDHLGAPRSIVDTTGATVWKWDKDPFGNGAPTGTLTYNLRFPGQYFDVETGLCYNMARDYSPALGRYIQSDPIGLRGGVNTYAYVGGNPINWVDPKGLYTEVVIWQPVGWWSSSFGHVSTDIDGTTYSYGTQGMSIMTTDDYIDRNSFRDGIGSVLDLTSDQEARLQSCMDSDQGSYSSTGNNCGSPIQNCLNQLGFSFSNLLPVSFGNSLLNSGLVSQFNFYYATKPGTGSSAPWAK
ncbi:MAG: RHS repeat protein [Deltaproteobacteria bacterium]|nr:RHS repeat protein [Deltaproteobacteria bacterium]